jgi:hypothetical protein
VEVHVDAPEILKQPFDTTLMYKRDRNHAFQEANFCVDDDRSFVPATGEQRFDLTPPPGLPPPPSD